MAVHRCHGRGVYSGSHVVRLLPLEANHRRKQQWQPAVVIKTASIKQRTMESVRSAFHAQLATVMDSLLAAAVCEIAKIFESSLCEQQAELAQKTEELSILRCKLEKVERKQKAKGGGSEEGEMSSGDREGSLRQQTLTGSGLNMGKDVSSHSDPVEGVSQSLGKLKEEVKGQDGTSVKHERAGSRPGLGSFTAQAPERSLAAGDEMQIDALTATQAKTKLSHWDQSSRGADHRALQDQASAPFLSISQSGRCSPRPDPSLTQPGEWLPGLDTTRGGVSSLENLQADSTSCTGAASSSSGTDAPCFRPGFGSDETSNEDDDNSFPFLDQEPENQNSNQNAERGAQQDQSQAPPGESLWRPRDERGGRASMNNTRRVTNFGNRDPLRPQSNTQLLTLRHTNALSHNPASSGGNGRPYTCPYCTKCFTYPSHQRRHLLRHTGVRLHPCQFCEKSFLTPSELTVHTRTHTGERPFGCAQCGKRFARSGNLRAHQRDVHMGKRPFACTECGKRFAHRGNLRVHNHRVHQGDPYYMDNQQEPDIVPNPI
ncbi:zinc finger and SCAN domain-containing protein 20-like isoform X1 [Pelmatolapia mariae]|uniref:zinc finger and SCAN domain-containing protein 20-like isoform X1 n=1 Tax=Pelmatolapia mariae TaxID=158779 RepID=UPI002FE63AAB